MRFIIFRYTNTAHTPSAYQFWKGAQKLVQYELHQSQRNEMVKKKGKSKRTSLKDKYKAERRVVASHRKSRKKTKKDAKAGVFRFDYKQQQKKKDPGIPNSWPFKEELLNEIAKARELSEQRKREKKTGNEKGVNKRENLEELIARANASRAEFGAKESSSSSFTTAKTTESSVRTPKNSLGQQSRRAYLQTLRKVIDTADILLQVLDARDPIGTRVHPSIENIILSHYDKKMVLVLNKIDLIPKNNVSDWLNYLRKSRPTVAIKCGTNIRGGDNAVGRADVDCQGALSSSCGVGVDGLMGLLKNYARSSVGTGKTCITVGIIGYPNVGKSSIINTLKRCRAVGVSSRPGFTTTMQEVVLDRNVRLVDSPGVVFDDTEDNEGGGAATLLRNCINTDSVDDPIPAVQALLNRCSAESLMMTYTIPAFPKGNVMMFLAMVAKRNGKVLKGGIPDKVMAARTVLRDWNGGKIPYFTRPPSLPVIAGKESGNDDSNDAKILCEFGDKFDLNKMDKTVLDHLENSDAMDFVQMQAEPLLASNRLQEKSAAAAIRLLTHGEDEMEEEDDEDTNDTTMEELEPATASRLNSSVANAEDYDFSSM